MASFKDTPLWVIVSFIVVTLFGNGAYWKWKESKLQSRQSQVDEALKLSNLEKEEAVRYQAIIELTNQYVQVRDDYANKPNPQANNKIIQLKAELDLLKNQFLGFEQQLARLENRPPRDIPITFVPPLPPTNLRIVPN